MGVGEEEGKVKEGLVAGVGRLVDSARMESMAASRSPSWLARVVARAARSRWGNRATH